MSVEVVALNSCQKQLKFTVPASDVKSELDRYYRDLRGKVRLRGFRPGKAPRKVLEARFGPQVNNDVAASLIQKSYDAAIEEHELETVGRPAVDDSVDLKPGIDFSFSITVDVRPEIEIETYTGVEVVFPKYEVDEAEVEAMVKARLEGQSRLVSVERPVEIGDMVLCELKSGDAINEPGTMIRTEADPYYPGLEEHLVGMKVDESKTATVSFGESRLDTVSGQELEVEIKIVSVQANEVPELSDELAEELGYEGGADGMRAALSAQAAEGREETARNQARANLLQKLIELNDFEVPQGMIDQNLELLKNELRLQQAYRGIDPRTVSFSPAQIADLRVRAEFAAKAGLILEYVTKTEKIEVTDADLDRKYQELADQRGQSIESIRGSFVKDDAVEELRGRLLEEKALDWLLEQSTLIDPPAVEEAPAAEEAAVEEKPKKKKKAKAKKEEAPAEEAAPAEASSGVGPWKKSMKKDELLAVAKEAGLDVNSKMKKADIVAALEAAG